MTTILEAKAVIKAQDATGSAFAQVQNKLKGIAATAKSFESLKGPTKLFSDLDNLGTRLGKSLGATAREIDILRKSWASFEATMRAGGPVKFAKYAEGARMWRAEMKGAFEGVRAEIAKTERAQEAHARRAARFSDARRFVAATAGLGGGAYAINRLGRAGIKASAVSQRESARDYLAGVSDSDSARIAKEAARSSSRYPSVDAATMHERLRDTAMSTRSTDTAIALSDTIAQGTTVLQSLKGKERAVEEGRKFFAALDVLGRNIEPERIRSLFDGFIKAQGVEGADMNLGGVFTMAKRLKAAGASVSDRFLMTSGVGLARDLGDDRAGNSVAMMMQQEVQATKQAKAYGAKYGLRDKQGRFVDRSLMMSDPDQWAWKNVDAAMRRAKLDPNKAEDVNTFLNSAYSNGSARDVLSKLMTQREQYQSKAGQFEKAAGLGAATPLLGKDPFVAFEAVQSQLRNLAAQAPIMDAAAAALGRLSGAIGGFNQIFSEGSRGEKIAAGMGIGAGAGIVGTAGYLGYRGLTRLLTGGSAALNGSAAALDASAAALTAAAARLAGGAAIATAAGAASPAAAAAAGAASGGVASRVWGAGAKALPFLGGVMSSPAAITAASVAALRYSVSEAGYVGMTSGERMRQQRKGSMRDMYRREWGYDADPASDGLSLPGGMSAGPSEVKAQIEGKAELATTVKVEASPYFMTTVNQIVDNKINAFRSSGGPATGSSGSTGRSSPDASPPM